MQADYSMKICNFDSKTNCYKAKTVPKIDSVDSSSGYISGGQTLKIKGFGF